MGSFYRPLSLSIFGPALLASALCACSQTAGPSSVAEISEDFAVEALPPHLEYRIEDQFDTLLASESNSVARGVINKLKRWPAEIGPIKVCFFGGSPAIRQKIVAAASQWMEHPVGIALDFGSASGRLCTRSEESHIRVGYRYAGYWSLVGQDSYILANQGEQSLNLQYFDVAAPGEPEFTRVVLHEFGHALGFEHEHQHPLSDCEEQFDWPAIYEYLAGPPNRWPQEQVDRQMRRLSADGQIPGPFDKSSIMLYTFPVRFYKLGANSSCYSAGNNSLSAGDRELLAKVYPSAPNALAQARNVLTEELATLIENAPATPFEKKLGAYVELQKLTTGTLPQKTIASFDQAQRNNVAVPSVLREVKPIG